MVLGLMAETVETLRVHLVAGVLAGAVPLVQMGPVWMALIQHQPALTLPQMVVLVMLIRAAAGLEVLPLVAMAVLAPISMQLMGLEAVGQEILPVLRT